MQRSRIRDLGISCALAGVAGIGSDTYVRARFWQGAWRIALRHDHDACVAQPDTMHERGNRSRTILEDGSGEITPVHETH